MKRLIFLIPLLFLHLYRVLPGAVDQRYFIGSWELDGIPPNANISFTKTFDAEGNFEVICSSGDKSVRTHFGKYVVKGDGVYYEMVNKETHALSASVAGQTTTIHYELKDNMKTMTAKGLPVNGNRGWVEVWKKIEMLADAN